MSRRSGDSNWTRRTLLQAGAGLAAYAALPRASSAATARPTNVCIDWPVDGQDDPEMVKASVAAAALRGEDLSKDPNLGAQALSAPSDPGDLPTIPSQAVFLNKWDVNILKVFFMRNVFANDRLADIVMDQVRQWSRVCNIKFEPTTNAGESHIRVGFNRGQGHSSFVGVENEQNRGKQTMNLAMDESSINRPENLAVILHEFGHAIGMLHEHSSPVSNIKFRSEQELVRFFQGRFGEGRNNPGKTLELVRHNIIRRYSDREVLRFSDFDRDSIMIYALPADVLQDGKEVRVNLQLSAKDKEYAEKLYGPSKDPGAPDTGGSNESRNPTQFTAGGDAVEVKLEAGATVELKFIVPSDQGDKELAIYTTGTTRVMLTLANSSGSITLADKTEHGSPDFMNEVIKKRLAAGDYKITIKHPSPRGGGLFKIQANTKAIDKYLFGPNKSQ